MRWLISALLLSAPPPTPEHFRISVEFPRGEGGRGWTEVTIAPDGHEVVVTHGDKRWVFDSETLGALRDRWGAKSFAPRWGSDRCSEGHLVWRYEYAKQRRIWCTNERATKAVAELSSLLQVLTQ